MMVEHVCIRIDPNLYFSFLIEDKMIFGSGFLKKQAREKISSSYTKKVKRAVIQYLEGKPVDLGQFETRQKLSSFENKVFTSLRKVPYGKTITYGELASKVGDPKLSRAVGNVLGRNKIPLFVPCHRVVSGKGVGGFMQGVEIKKTLLSIESK